MIGRMLYRRPFGRLPAISVCQIPFRGLGSNRTENPGSPSDLVQSMLNTEAGPHSGSMKPPMLVHKPVAHRA
jgi:hypothetical protein